MSRGTAVQKIRRFPSSPSRAGSPFPIRGRAGENHGYGAPAYLVQHVSTPPPHQPSITSLPLSSVRLLVDAMRDEDKSRLDKSELCRIAKELCKFRPFNLAAPELMC